MRRLVGLRDRRAALVAVYDALLFLMVVILISEGMFLYTATSVTGGGDLSDAHYQRVTDNQRVLVEALSLNETHPIPLIHWTNGTANETLPLDQVVGKPEANTSRWLLESYCELTWRNEEGGDDWDGEWDTSTILPLVDTYFSENRLNGTEHAWLFLYEGEVVLFGSSSIDSVEDLPEDRWASSGFYSVVVQSGGAQSTKYSAELRYFLWLP